MLSNLFTPRGKMSSVHRLLEALPLDVWATIADNLDVVSRTCLHLAAKKLYDGLPRKKSLLKGDHSWYDTQYSDADRVKFLLLLDRDLPDSRLCSRHTKFCSKSANEPRCDEGRIHLGRNGYIPWGYVQLLMRKISYGWTIDNVDFVDGKYFKGGISYQEIAGWTNLIHCRVVFGRLLYHIEYKRVVKGHFPAYATRPAEFDLEILKGVPTCRCRPIAPSTEDRMEKTVRCAMRHQGTKQKNPLKRICPRSTIPVELCYWCDGTRKCEVCGTEWKVFVRKWPDLASHAYLTVERIIDVGPVDWVLRQDQFSQRWHPVWRHKSDGTNVDRQHPCFRTNTELFKEWDVTVRDRIIGLRTRAGARLDQVLGRTESSQQRMRK